MAVATAPQAAATTRQPKGWLATLIVALLMILIVGGGLVAESAVATVPPVGVKVGTGVYVYPIKGWEFAGRSEDLYTVLLTNGTGSLAVHGSRITGGVAPFRQGHQLDDKREEWLETGTVTASEPEPVTVGPYSGRRFHYTGTFEDVPMPVEGEVTAVDEYGDEVLFDGWAGIGQYETVRDDVDAMISSAVIK